MLRHVPLTPSVLYHVTHYANAGLILNCGLSIERARCDPRIWLCSEHKLAWAVQHVSQSHGWTEGDMMAFSIDSIALSQRILRARDGVFYVRDSVPVVAILGVATGRLVLARAG